ncbi:MAG: hypothetical protein OET44_11200 [Gammaproteobacteria bacterium]|nr:hypothetical protein [Gammaproteobacteria bacterium]
MTNTITENQAHPECPSRDEQSADAPFPIVEHLPVSLADEARTRAECLARSMLDSDPRLATIGPFGEHVHAGFSPGPCLFIEDHHAIRLFEILGNQAYSYRTLLLARPGDLVVIGGRRSPDFERYCAQTLGFGPVEILEPALSQRVESLAARCGRDRAAIDIIAACARSHRGINIVPYMGNGAVWALAGVLASRAGTPVHVCAPPPRLTRSVNDKIWFSAAVDRLLGKRAVPTVWPVSGSAVLAVRVAQLARDHASLVIKLPDSASSKGNLLLDSASVAGRPLRELRQYLLALMRRANWQKNFPVLVSAWEQPVLVSPSVHLWIPAAHLGNPLVEAIFEQKIVGTSGKFTGAVPTTLPTHWQQRLADEAALLGVLFQHLGYVGRCSFDAILVGPTLERAALHWIECNGRWGGVSLPVTLAARLFGDWQSRPFIIAERSGLPGASHSLSEILAELGDELLVTDYRQAGAVILSPSPLEMGTGYDVMVFDDDIEAAERRAARVDAILTRTL